MTSFPPADAAPGSPSTSPAAQGRLCARHLYVSRLAPALSFETIRPILQVSRDRNPALGVRGVLLFDGERFMQLLEGEPDVVAALVARIAADERHVEMQVLYSGVEPGPPLCTNWRAGYTEPDALAPWAAPGAPSGRAAVDAFIAVAARSDTLS